jgi:hypothetical protein
MALVPVGSDHSVAGIIHVQILRDGSSSDPQSAFTARINAPGVPPQMLPLNNNSSLDFPVHSGNVNGDVHVEVDDFRLLPGGAAPADATAIACKIVFKLKAIIFSITLGSVDVTAAVK